MNISKIKNIIQPNRTWVGLVQCKQLPLTEEGHGDVGDTDRQTDSYTQLTGAGEGHRDIGNADERQVGRQEFTGGEGDDKRQPTPRGKRPRRR